MYEKSWILMISQTFFAKSGCVSHPPTHPPKLCASLSSSAPSRTQDGSQPSRIGAGFVCRRVLGVRVFDGERGRRSRTAWNVNKVLASKIMLCRHRRTAQKTLSASQNAHTCPLPEGLVIVHTYVVSWPCNPETKAHEPQIEDIVADDLHVKVPGAIHARVLSAAPRASSFVHGEVSKLRRYSAITRKYTSHSKKFVRRGTERWWRCIRISVMKFRNHLDGTEIAVGCVSRSSRTGSHSASR